MTWNVDDQEFERQKLCYSENSEHARSLNAQLNTIPALAVTVTGGLWFGAGVTQNLHDGVRFSLLIFAGLTDVVLILAAFRIRNVFESHLEILQAFYPPAFPPETPGKAMFPSLSRYSMVKMYCGLILVVALASFIGAFALYWPAPQKWIFTGVLSIVLLMLSAWILVTKSLRQFSICTLIGIAIIAVTVISTLACV